MKHEHVSRHASCIPHVSLMLAHVQRNMISYVPDNSCSSKADPAFLQMSDWIRHLLFIFQKVTKLFPFQFSGPDICRILQSSRILSPSGRGSNMRPTLLKAVTLTTARKG